MTKKVMTEQRRERIAALYAEGKTQQEIAAELKTSQRTVSRDLETLAIVAKVDRVDNLGRKNTGRPAGKGAKKRGPKPGEKQAQRSINISDADWDWLKGKADADGVSAAQMLGDLVTRFRAQADEPPLSKSDNAKLAAAERRMRKEMEAEFERRFDDAILNFEYREMLPEVKRYFEAVDIVIGAAKHGIWTDNIWKIVMQCVHPDNKLSASDENRNRATRVLNHYRDVLVLKKDNPSFQPPALPKTLSQYVAQKRRVQRERKEKGGKTATIAKARPALAAAV